MSSPHPALVRSPIKDEEDPIAGDLDLSLKRQNVIQSKLLAQLDTENVRWKEFDNTVHDVYRDEKLEHIVGRKEIELERTVKSLQTANAKLQYQLECKEEFFIKAQREAQQKTKELLQLKLDMKRYQSRTEHFKQENKALEEQLQTIERKDEQWRDEITWLSAELEGRNLTVAQLRKKVEELQTETGVWKTKAVRAVNQLNSKQNDTEAILEAAELLKEDVESLRKELEDKDRDISANEEALQLQKGEMLEWQEKVTLLQREERRLREECNTSAVIIDKWQRKYARLKSETQGQTHSDWRRRAEERAGEIAVLSEERDSLRVRYEAQRQKQHAVSIQLQESQEKCMELRERLEKIDGELQAVLEANLQSEVGMRFRREMEQLQYDLQHAKEALTESNQQLEIVTAELESERQAAPQLAEARQKLEEENLRLNQQSSHSHQKTRELERELAKTGIKVNKLHQDLSTANERYETERELRFKVQQANAEITKNASEMIRKMIRVNDESWREGQEEIIGLRERVLQLENSLADMIQETQSNATSVSRVLVEAMSLIRSMSKRNEVHVVEKLEAKSKHEKQLVSMEKTIADLNHELDIHSNDPGKRMLRIMDTTKWRMQAGQMQQELEIAKKEARDNAEEVDRLKAYIRDRAVSSPPPPPPKLGVE